MTDGGLNAPLRQAQAVWLGYNRLMGHQHDHDHLPPPLGNLRQPMPFPKMALRLVINLLLRVKNRNLCCGNPGQPGC